MMEVLKQDIHYQMVNSGINGNTLMSGNTMTVFLLQQVAKTSQGTGSLMPYFLSRMTTMEHMIYI